MLRCFALSAALAVMLAGCQAPQPPQPRVLSAAPACAVGDKMIQTTLWFGLSKPQGGTVNEAEWQRFLNDDVTPRFQAGLSVYEARGQWQEKNGTVAHEHSKALMLIHGEDVGESIEALRTIYKKRFAQESVMRVDTPVCVSF